MKYMRRLAVVATGVAALGLGTVPGHATTTATAAIDGEMYLSSGFPSGGSAGATLVGSGPCGSATTAPAVQGGTCGLGVSGTATGSCAIWSADVSGWLQPTTSVGSYMSYSVSLHLATSGGVVSISGTASNAGGTYSVTGAGTLTNVINYDGSDCMLHPTYAFMEAFAGALTIER